MYFFLSKIDLRRISTILTQSLLFELNHKNNYSTTPNYPYWPPFADMIDGEKAKEHHKWEQSVFEAEYYLRHLCPRSESVLVDPMMASGSTLIGGLHLGMKCIGIDIDAEAFGTAKERIEKIQKIMNKRAA